MIAANPPRSITTFSDMAYFKRNTNLMNKHTGHRVSNVILAKGGFKVVLKIETDSIYCSAAESEVPFKSKTNPR